MTLQVLIFVACVALAAAETEIPISHSSVAKLTNPMPYMQNTFMHPMMYTRPISHQDAMAQQMFPMMPLEKTTAMKMTPETVMPAHYNFGYEVNDPITGDQKMQTEMRHGNNVQGRYSLVESDGTKRIVDYTADALNGFNAVVSKEPIAAHIKTFLPTTNVIDNIAPVNNMMGTIMPTTEMFKSIIPATKIMGTFAPAINMLGDIVPAAKSMETMVPASAMLQDGVPTMNMVESNMPIMKYGSPIMPLMNQDFRMVAPQMASFATPFSGAYMISNTQPMQHMYKSAYSAQFMK